MTYIDPRELAGHRLTIAQQRYRAAQLRREGAELIYDAEQQTILNVQAVSGYAVDMGRTEQFSRPWKWWYNNVFRPQQSVFDAAHMAVIRARREEAAAHADLHRAIERRARVLGESNV